MSMNKYILDLAKKEDCFYLYDESVIKKQIGMLKSSFPNVEFLFSVKCNPNKNVLKTVFNLDLGSDAASLNEVYYSRDMGLSKDKIFYSCPGKTEDDIKNALPISTIIADSLNEVEKISKISGHNKLDIGLRINPNYSFNSNIPMLSKFGIDEDQIVKYLKSNIPDNIRVAGIHVHLKSQELEQNTLLKYYANTLDLANRIERVLGYTLSYINLGSGIGIAYSESDKELSIEKLGKETEELISEFRSSHPSTRIMIETGRYAVCQSGTYVTHVLDIKVSQGKNIVILKNTLNGFIRPSIVKLIEKYNNGENLAPSEPIFTKKDAFKIEAPYENRPIKTYTLMGNLCTAADIIADNIELPELNIGDIVTINNAGAYAYVLSPLQFSSQNPPKEFMLFEDGQIEE